LRGTNRIAADPFGFDLFPTPSFDRIVDPDHQFAAWSKGRDEHSQRHLGGLFSVKLTFSIARLDFSRVVENKMAGECSVDNGMNG
jgi:hypothetical protein